MSELLAGRPLTQPHPDRLGPDHPVYEQILQAHATALASGDPMYRDPASGYWVLTAAYLADRGSCCDNGCRHCPYVA
ncbi:MAG TPA: DUF5522 domain-containing protein [Acidimicrobiales bacterium]|jgi:hypothetical protein